MYRIDVSRNPSSPRANDAVIAPADVLRKQRTIRINGAVNPARWIAAPNDWASELPSDFRIYGDEGQPLIRVHLSKHHPSALVLTKHILADRDIHICARTDSSVLAQVHLPRPTGMPALIAMRISQASCNYIRGRFDREPAVCMLFERGSGRAVTSGGAIRCHPPQANRHRRATVPGTVYIGAKRKAWTLHKRIQGGRGYVTPDKPTRHPTSHPDAPLKHLFLPSPQATSVSASLIGHT